MSAGARGTAGPGSIDAGESVSPTLAGRTIVVTRPKEDAGELATMLERRGATVLLAPAIDRRPVPSRILDEAIRELASGRHAWLVVTSAAGVHAVLGRLPALGIGPEVIRAKLAAVGEGTAAALRRLGIEPDLVPRTYTTRALGRAMPLGTGSVLLARADIASEELEGELKAKGWTTRTIDAYAIVPRTRMPRGVATALRGGRVDAVTFTSSSTVIGFVAMAGPLTRDGARLPPAVCIGPVTARRARQAGLRVDAVARPHTIEGLVAVLERRLGDRGGGHRGGHRKERSA